MTQPSAPLVCPRESFTWVALACASFTLVVGLHLLGVFAWFDPEHAPAWIQAVGVVAGVFTAVLIAQRQQALQLELHRSQRVSMQKMVIALAGTAKQGGVLLTVGIDREDVVAIKSGRLMMLEAQYLSDKVRPEYIEPAHVIAFVAMRSALTVALSLAEELVSRPNVQRNERRLIEARATRDALSIAFDALCDDPANIESYFPPAP